MAIDCNYKVVYPDSVWNKYYDNITRVRQSGFTSRGDMTKEFEDALTEYVGQEVITVSNAGSGLFLLFKYLKDIGKKSVGISCNTYRATVDAARMAGLKIVLIDIDESLTVDMNKLDNAFLNKDIDIFCNVNIGGYYDFLKIDTINEICSRYDSYFVEDNAHSFGTFYNWNSRKFHAGVSSCFDRMVGSVFSFYATKAFNIGEGGCVTSNNKSILSYMRNQRNYNFRCEDNWILSKTPLNFRISEFTAALGLALLGGYNNMILCKDIFAMRLSGILNGRSGILRYTHNGTYPCWYKYIIYDFDNYNGPQSGKVFGKCVNDTDNYSYFNEGCSNGLLAKHKCIPIHYGCPLFELNDDELRVQLKI